MPSDKEEQQREAFCALAEARLPKHETCANTTKATNIHTPLSIGTHKGKHDNNNDINEEDSNYSLRKYVADATAAEVEDP